MERISVSTKIYWILILIRAVSNAIFIFLPFPSIFSSQSLPASKPIISLVNALITIILYGGLGFIGLKLSHKLGFADVWDTKVTNKQRFLLPALIGAVLGIIFILTDSIIGSLQSFGHFIHPPFPTSLVVSLSAGIGEELMFRLFFISFWTWVISYLILKRKHLNKVFWIITILSAIVFAVGHFPALFILYNLKSVADLPLLFVSEILLLNSLVSLFAAYYFRKYGFLAAVGIHFWADIVWHVIYGVV